MTERTNGASPQHERQSVSPIAMANELHISIEKTTARVSYIGTRDQLEDESIIPAELEWPQGFNSLYWESDRFCFRLKRTRPEGGKGPQKDFVDYDRWDLSWWRSVHMTDEDYGVAQKRKELAAAVYRNSYEGRQEWGRNWGLYCAARADKHFQAFKARIPALALPKRGRKSSSPTGGACDE